MRQIKPGLYQHYKGGTVKVLLAAHQSETLEDMVVYECLYECRDFGKGSIWVRPADMFFEEIEVDGKMVQRFKEITESD